MFDILAVGTKQLRMIQVKSNYCRPKERENIIEYKAPDYAVKELWVYKDGIREPIIKIL